MEGLQGFLKKVQIQISKDKKIWAVSFGLAFLLTALWSCGAAYSQNVQQGIADKVVRFHVRANSDSQEDQTLKLCVRDSVLEQMRPILADSAGKEETKVLLQEAFPEIRQAARRVIKEQGYDYEVKVSLVEEVFPMKQYGDLSFPAGVYDALRVDIGKAEGQNWWCVMFPPMCFVDVTSGEVNQESKDNLAETLTQEEYTVISALGEESGVTPVIKFKIVEWWQEKWLIRECNQQAHSLKSAMQ